MQTFNTFMFQIQRASHTSKGEAGLQAIIHVTKQSINGINTSCGNVSCFGKQSAYLQLTRENTRFLFQWQDCKYRTFEGCLHTRWG